MALVDDEEDVVVSVRVDGGSAWSETTLDGNGTATLVLTDLADGTHRVEARAEYGGGVDASPLAYEFVVDTVPPDVRMLAVPQDGDDNSSPALLPRANVRTAGRVGTGVGNSGLGQAGRRRPHADGWGALPAPAPAMRTSGAAGCGPERG